MPKRFVLEVATRGGGWIDHGLFERDSFMRLQDGSYLCAGQGGSPMYLRCVGQHADVLEVPDGGGGALPISPRPVPGTLTLEVRDHLGAPAGPAT